MSPDNMTLAAVVAAIVAFVVAFMKRGQKLKQYKGAVEAQTEVKDVVEKMGTAVPTDFHIDRVLGERAAAKRAASQDSSKGDLP